MTMAMSRDKPIYEPKFEISIKDSGHRLNQDFAGDTTWNAVQIIQKKEGIKLKMNDPTFTTTEMTSDGTPNGHQNWLEWLYAGDCGNQIITAFGNLKGTNLKFPQSILPVDVTGFRDQSTTHFGTYNLSENDKRITATTMGRCAATYYGRMAWNAPTWVVGTITHEIPVIFDNEGED